MKLVIPWVCAFALFVGCFYLYSTTKEDEKEMAQLRQDEAEVARLRSDNLELKQLRLDHEELGRMKNEHEELLRLRSETGQLRKQTKELTAQLNTVRAQAAVKQTSQSPDLATENKALRTQFEQLQQRQERANSAACIHNLQLIESAKELWAREAQKPPGTVPNNAELTPYFPNNTFPICPDNGAYTLNALGIPPTCSIVGHALPRQ